ncbi:nitroreductase [Okibacterium sp. HSC-33S16]|nr:nitroreductase [Okibacterium sp. HSC-33S16]
MTAEAPTHDDLVPLVAASARVADHGALRPWRLIELRGDDRVRLGDAIAQAEHDDKPSQKPLRASLLIAVVVSPKKSAKVPHWEQEAVASGVAHTLSLLLADAGWGVIWRTGHTTRTKPVRKLHGLTKKEQLLGWLYVGGIPENAKVGHRKVIDGEEFLSRLP